MGELQYVIEHEDIRGLDDLFLRRTEVYYQDPENGAGVAAEAARRIADRLGRDEGWQAEAIAAWRRRIADGLAFRGPAA